MTTPLSSVIRTSRPHSSDSFDASNPGGSGGSNSPIVSPGGFMLPSDDLNATQFTNVNQAAGGVNTGYLVQKHLPCQVNFTKATTAQTSGTTAGVNFYLAIYDINGNLQCSIKFTTLAASAILNGTITQGGPNVILGTGDYYFVVVEDSVPAAGTIAGIPTTVTDINMRNQNQTRNATLINFLSGGLVPTTINVAAWTKTNGGHMSSNAVAAVFVEP